MRDVGNVAADWWKQRARERGGGERHRRWSGAANGRCIRSGVVIHTPPLWISDVARNSRPFPAVMPKARVRFHPHLQAVRSVACDQLRMPIAVEIDGGDIAQRLWTADDLGGPGCGEPDAHDSRIRRIERDMVTMPVAVEVRDDGTPGCVRARRKQEDAQAGQMQSAAQ